MEQAWFLESPQGEQSPADQGHHFDFSLSALSLNLNVSVTSVQPTQMNTSVEMKA